MCEEGNAVFFSSRRRHTMSLCDWSSDVCSSDLLALGREPAGRREDGMNHSTTMTTSRMENTLDQPVLAPASRFTAERENEALVAKLPNRPALILDSPWATRSWFSFQRVPACWCSTLALEAVSRKLTSQ